MLTRFCFGAGCEALSEHMLTYDEGVRHPPVVSTVTAAVRLIQRAYAAKQRVAHFTELVRTLDESALVRAPFVDATKWEALCKRRIVYGDLTQCVSEDELREALLKSGNDLPTTMLLLAKIANERGHEYQPPAYFRSCDLANVKYLPPLLHADVTPRSSQTDAAAQ